MEIRHAQVPMGKMGDAWDVANATLFGSYQFHPETFYFKSCPPRRRCYATIHDQFLTCDILRLIINRRDNIFDGEDMI
jgi:hypothetical protein